MESTVNPAVLGLWTRVEFIMYLFSIKSFVICYVYILTIVEHSQWCFGRNSYEIPPCLSHNSTMSRCHALELSTWYSNTLAVELSNVEMLPAARAKRRRCCWWGRGWGEGNFVEGGDRRGKGVWVWVMMCWGWVLVGGVFLWIFFWFWIVKAETCFFSEDDPVSPAYLVCLCVLFFKN